MTRCKTIFSRNKELLFPDFLEWLILAAANQDIRSCFVMDDPDADVTAIEGIRYVWYPSSPLINIDCPTGLPGLSTSRC